MTRPKQYDTPAARQKAYRERKRNTASHDTAPVCVTLFDMPASEGDTTNEWYTPAWVIEKARQVLGGIDLDPASCATAQTVVQAARYYTAAENGLLQPWYGRVFCNPPYSYPLIEQFTTQAHQAYAAGDVQAAILVVNNATDTNWWYDLARRYAFCLLRERLRFWHPTKKTQSARQGQTVFYIGRHPRRFARVFADVGLIVTSTYKPEAPQ
jgi:ParB family chromosome partitioning protein